MTFEDVQAAYDVLSDPARRAKYDAETSSTPDGGRALAPARSPLTNSPGPCRRAWLAHPAFKVGAQVVAHAEVDLDDMAWDEAAGAYTAPCRCSGVYTITENQLDEGYELAACSLCSLRIRVLYTRAPDADDPQGQR